MRKIELDNRGLQAPEPMVRILGALAALGSGDSIVALMDHEPLLLYPELERRGFAWKFEDTPAGFVITIAIA